MENKSSAHYQRLFRQRLREQGSADPSSLFDLLNGYVTIDGSVVDLTVELTTTY